MGLFGVPGEIGSDNGSQFVNKIINHLLQALHTEHVRISAYSHEENGLVERADKEILRFLRAIVNGKARGPKAYRLRKELSTHKYMGFSG